MKRSIIKDKSFTFALRIIAMSRLLREQKEYELAPRFCVREQALVQTLKKH